VSSSNSRLYSSFNSTKFPPCYGNVITRKDNVFEEKLIHPTSKEVQQVIEWITKLKAKDDYVRGFEDARAEAISSLYGAIQELEYLQKNVYDNEFLYYL
jgi:hypothetical protein